MQKAKNGFLKGRLKAVTYAFRGFKILISSEDSFKAQFCVGLFTIILGFIFKISIIEWMIQLIAIALVLVAEACNTMVEKLADFVNPNYNKNIGVIKDIGAGAALIAAIIALIIGCIIYIPKIINLFS